jgi:PHD/YefM family antitoxin component YafN of YafNO toxin-antitoxin module
MATTLSSKEFDVESAKKSADDGPVFLTEDGHKTHVLLSVESYKRFTTEGLTLGDLLSNPAAAEIEFELPEREAQEFLSLGFE